MKKITLVKITLDILMSVVFVLLLNKTVLGGMEFHKIAGLGIGAAFLLHCALNWKWIKAVSTKLFSKNTNIKTKIGYVLDIILFINFIIIIITGVIIEKKHGSMVYKMLHISGSYLTLIIVGIHVGLHWNFVMNAFKNIFKINNKNKVLTYIARVLTVLLLAFGIYNMVSSNFISRATGIVSIFSASSPNGGSKVNSNGAPMRSPGSQDKGRQVKNSDTSNTTTKESTTTTETESGTNTITNDNINNTKGSHDRPAPTNGGGHNSTNVFEVMSTYLGIMSVFSISIYYFEKLLARKRFNRIQKAV